jgi:hypothetical protein
VSRFRARATAARLQPPSDLVLLAEPEATTEAPSSFWRHWLSPPLPRRQPVPPRQPWARPWQGCSRRRLAAADQAPAGAQSAAQSHFLSVTLDDGLVRSFLVTPPRGAQGLRELRATAAARFAGLYGESAEQWLLDGDWHARSPFVVCALPRVLWRALDQWAQAHSWRLDSMTPALVRVCNRLCASIPSRRLAAGRLRADADVCSISATTRSQVLRSLLLPGVAGFRRARNAARLRSFCDCPAGHGACSRQSLLWAGAADWLPAAATHGRPRVA